MVHKLLDEVHILDYILKPIVGAYFKKNQNIPRSVTFSEGYDESEVIEKNYLL